MKFPRILAEYSAGSAGEPDAHTPSRVAQGTLLSAVDPVTGAARCGHRSDAGRPVAGQVGRRLFLLRRTYS